MRSERKREGDGDRLLPVPKSIQPHRVHAVSCCRSGREGGDDFIVLSMHAGRKRSCVLSCLFNGACLLAFFLGADPFVPLRIG